MHLDSARELKLAVAARLDPAAARREFPELTVPARRGEEVERCQPTLALGIAGNDAGGFQLALRVQQRALLDSVGLAAIRSRARGEIDVRYIGAVAKQQPWQQTRVRPMLIGSSVAHHEITAGTIGAFVRREGQNEPLLLSNNHVLADENRAQIGDEILQPGAFDGGQLGRDTVATLDRFVALDPDQVNEVDCAVAAIVDGVEVEECTLRDLGELAGTVSPEEATEVTKLGRTTGLTRGRVTAFEIDNLVVQYDSGLFRFDNQLEVSGLEGAFSQPGDSGSLIVAEPEYAAAGLLFAGSDQGGPGNAGLTYANPIGAALDRLGIELQCGR
jgi:hypothetical protein